MSNDAPTAAPTLKINEIFYSLQGEANTAGLPTAFIRLTGCPLRCGYCDSEYAFHGGERLELVQVLTAVDKYQPRYVCVTGGEPLAQANCLPLLKALCDAGYSVSLETSGAMPIEKVDERVSIVMDIKTPGSEEVARNRYENLQYLKQKDQLKFVLCHRDDYEWARFKVEEYQLHQRVSSVWFSPSYGQLNATDLANWIVNDNLPVRFQVQLHKQLWDDAPGY